ncbi:MAG: peptidylprolyl isomerase, partial [Candidatus Zixiibacteriota bacterium]
MNSRYLVCVLLALVLASLAGCSKNDNPTLVTVGEYDIKFDEYYQRYGNWRLNPVSAEDEFQKKKDLLDSLVVIRLLINAAYEKNLDKLEELSRIILANRNRFLLDALYQEKIMKDSNPSDAEVKEFYKNLEFQVRASHILVDNLDTANMLVEKLKSGVIFEKLAYEYSIDQSAKRNHGDLGYFLWGAMIDEFQKAAFAMQPGEISPPVKTSYGYHIIKVVDRAPNDLRGEFAVIKDTLKTQLRSMNLQQRMAAYMVEIKAKYNVKVDTATCDYLIFKRSELYPPDLMSQIPKNDFDLEALDRNEKELVLATWDGGQISLIEYFSLARRVPETARPNFDQYDSLASFIFRLKTEEILAIEATKIGLEQGDIFKKNINRFKELTMADIMKNDSIPQLAAPTEEDARKYFDEHQNEFTEAMKIHAYEIQLSDEIKATKLKEQIKSVIQFKEKAMDLTERPGKRAVGGDLQYIERQWYPEIFDLAQKTPAGKVAGPVFN